MCGALTDLATGFSTPPYVSRYCPLRTLDPPPRGGGDQFVGGMREAALAGSYSVLRLHRGLATRMRASVPLEARPVFNNVRSSVAAGTSATSGTGVASLGRTPATRGFATDLTRGEPTDVVCTSGQEGTSIHWHGSRGELSVVAGWSGEGKTMAPAVVPGAHSTALTLPRAGTFMYHPHRRSRAGNGGSVGRSSCSAGERYDPSHDHVYIALVRRTRCPVRLPTCGQGDPPVRRLSSSPLARDKFSL